MKHTPRDIVEMIDEMIKIRVALRDCDHRGIRAHLADTLETNKRAIVDYLLETNPNKGVYKNPEER